jgi:chromosome segregation ATPase
MTKHRPVADRIAETQAQLSALIAKANKTQINESPEIQALDKQIKDIQVSMLKFNRWASEGEEKIENFQSRVVEWENRLATATEKRLEANTQIEALRLERKALAESMAGDIEVEA